MTTFSASRTRLAGNCLHFTTLEHDEVTGPQAIDGTRRHKVIEDWICDGIVPDGESWFDDFRKWYDEHTPFSAPIAEAAYAFDIDTTRARYLGSRIGREYNCSETEIPGTADVVFIDGSDVSIMDWKFHGCDWHADIAGEPDEFGQLMTLATMVYLSHFTDATVENAPLFHLSYVHIYDDGRIVDNTATVSICDILRFIRRLYEVFERGTDPVLGDHCTELYCPAISRCCAARDSVSAIIDADLTAGINSEIDLCTWLAVKPLANKIMKNLDAQAKKYLDEHGDTVGEKNGVELRSLSLPDGSTYETTSSVRTKFDKDLAAAMIGESVDDCISTTVVVTTRHRKAEK